MVERRRLSVGTWLVGAARLLELSEELGGGALGRAVGEVED